MLLYELDEIGTTPVDRFFIAHPIRFSFPVARITTEKDLEV